MGHPVVDLGDTGKPREFCVLCLPTKVNLAQSSPGNRPSKYACDQTCGTEGALWCDRRVRVSVTRFKNYFVMMI